MRLPFQRKNQPAAARDSPKPLRSDAFLLEAMDAWGDVVYRVALAQTGSAQRRRRRVPGRVHAPAGTRHRVRKRRAPESLAAARHGEPLPRLGAFDLEPPHGRLHAGACRHPRPRRVRRRHLGGRGRVARPTCASRCTCSTSRATPPKRSRASRDADPAPCEPASTAPASSCGTCWKTTAANASRALQAAATPYAERSRTVTDPRNPGPRPTVDEYRTMMRGTHVPDQLKQATLSEAGRRRGRQR